MISTVDREFLQKNFKCRMCGACCRIKNGFVRVTDNDITRFAALLGKLEEEIIEEFTDISPDRAGLVLKSRPDGACVFLTDDCLCIVNDVKPAKCGTFPFDWVNPDSHEVCPALKELATCTK